MYFHLHIIYLKADLTFQLFFVFHFHLLDVIMDVITEFIMDVIKYFKLN